MFDSFGSNGNGKGDSATLTDNVVTVRELGSKEETTPEVKGLCVNCAHLETCRLPRPAQGVWHCEEYELAETSE